MMPMTAAMTQMVVATKVTSNSRSNTGRDRNYRKSIDQVAIRHTSRTVRCHMNHSHLLHDEQPCVHLCVFRPCK